MVNILSSPGHTPLLLSHNLTTLLLEQENSLGVLAVFTAQLEGGIWPVGRSVLTFALDSYLCKSVKQCPGMTSKGQAACHLCPFDSWRI